MDRQYRFSKYSPSLREHDYGRNVKLIDDPYLTTLVSRMSDQKTKQPLFNCLLRESYRYMLGPVLNNEIPVKDYPTKTRMYASNKKAVCRTKKFPPKTSFAIANLIRAGIIPSLTVYEQLFLISEPSRVRLDNIFISRVTNKKGRVKGANIAGAKMGDSNSGNYVLIPDPMGATGSSTVKVLNLYKMMKGTAKKFIIMGLYNLPR
jgi:uracil phosphoribosyltransferase